MYPPISSQEKDTGAFLNGFKSKKYNAESANDPGQYDGHLTAFASEIKTTVNFGEKYKFVPKEGPPPGSYNPDQADGLTKSKIRSTLIREDLVPNKR